MVRQIWLYALADPKRLRLAVAPPPLLLAAFAGDVERLVYHMQRLSDDASRSLSRGATPPGHGDPAVAALTSLERAQDFARAGRRAGPELSARCACLGPPGDRDSGAPLLLSWVVAAR